MERDSDQGSPGGAPTSQILDEATFRRLVALEADRAIRYQDFFALCLVRPDQMNPTDRSGETLARTVARKISEFVRSSDLVGWLGEGIGVLLLHAASNDALSVAERLRSQIGNVRFQAEPSSSVRRITLSVGEVSFPQDGHNESMLLARARERLDKALRSGGNRVVEADNG